MHCTKNAKRNENAEASIRTLAKRAAREFRSTQDMFTAMFANNPRAAIDNFGEELSRAQVARDFWSKVAEVANQRGAARAVAYAEERIDVDLAFLSRLEENTTSAWTLALCRASADVFHVLSRTEIARLRDMVAREEGRA